MTLLTDLIQKKQEVDAEKINVKKEAENMADTLCDFIKSRSQATLYKYNLTVFEDEVLTNEVISELINIFNKNNISVVYVNEPKNPIALEVEFETYGTGYMLNMASILKSKIPVHHREQRIIRFIEKEADNYNSLIQCTEKKVYEIVKKISFSNMIDYDAFMCALYRAGYDVDSCYQKYITDDYRTYSYYSYMSQRIRNCVEISHNINKEKLNQKVEEDTKDKIKSMGYSVKK